VKQKPLIRPIQNRNDEVFGFGLSKSCKSGQVFVGYAFAEGRVRRKDPETHVGQLTEALLRNVRFLSAIGLHTGYMSVAESEKTFRESAFANEGDAHQQAARGTFDPAYLNYTMGKLMIRWSSRAPLREFMA
jgi:Bacterial protein of unknown function (DUF885)